MNYTNVDIVHCLGTNCYYIFTNDTQIFFQIHLYTHMRPQFYRKIQAMLKPNHLCVHLHLAWHVPIHYDVVSAKFRMLTIGTLR